MRVTICGPNLRDQTRGEFHVHAEGCGDLARGARREPAYREGWTIDAASPEDVAMAVYDPDEHGYDPETEIDNYVGEFHFFPCTEGLA